MSCTYDNSFINTIFSFISNFFVSDLSTNGKLIP